MTEIHVSNLSYEVTEDELRNAFEEYGEVTWVTIMIDRDTSRSRGFAFVMMPSDSEAKQAIEALDRIEMAGRLVSVKQSKGKSSR